MTSIFRRKGRKGWTLKFRAPDGSWRFEQKKTRELAEERALELRQAPQTGQRHQLFRDYAEVWLARVRQHLRRGSATVYTTSMTVHLLPAFGHLPIRGITRGMVKDFIAGKLREGFARKYVTNMRGVLHGCLEEAREDGLIFTNPAHRGKALRLAPSKAEQAQKVKAFDADQLRRLLATTRATAPRWWMLFRIMSLTGLRLGEALALQWEDVDLVGRSLYVRRGYTRYRIEPTKTGHQRHVDLAAPLVEELKRHDAEQKAAALKAGARKLWLFPSRLGNPSGHEYAQAAFKRALKAAGLPPHHTPHSLRHTYASLLLTLGKSIYYVQRQMGHASITMTVDLYGRWLPAEDHSAVDALAQAVEGHHEKSPAPRATRAKRANQPHEKRRLRVI